MDGAMSARENDFHSHHDEHQDDDAPLEGEKRVKTSKMSKRLKSARDSSSKHSRKDSTTYVSKQQSQHQEWDAWEEENVVDEDEYGNTKEKKYILSLYKIHAEEFSEPNLEENLNRWVQKEFKTLSMKMQNEQILVMRANNKPNSFSEADFKYLNKNDIEDLYYLCRSKEIDNRKVKLMNSLITFIRSCVIWERVYDFFPAGNIKLSNEGLIYLNSKYEKRVMYLEEIVKFCDATLEKVLNEVKLRMFESKFLKKPHLLEIGIFCEWKTNSTDDEASSKKDAGMDKVLDCFLLDEPLAGLPKAAYLQPCIEQLSIPIHHAGDNTAVGETSLSFALMNVHACAEGAKKHDVALRQLMMEIVFTPLSSQTWVGEDSTSVAPLSVEDYDEEDTDDALGSVVAVPKLETCRF
ncbi:hypothetical protein Tco_1568707 [Tanacetum coccineum]